MSIARRTSASDAWLEASRDLAGVVATHADGQYGQRDGVVGGHRIFVVAARPARVHGGMELDGHRHGSRSSGL
jgi:hypothetical protein